MNLDTWVDLVCDELNLARPDVRAVLELARDVAHGIDRPAAPVTALLAGLAAKDEAALPEVMDRIRVLLATATEVAG
jgi:hypothetical protein